MATDLQYHILVKGFELEKRNKDGDSRKTDLRHYRYDTASYALSLENGAWVVRNGKALVAGFPVNNSMVLVEEVEQK